MRSFTDASLPYHLFDATWIAADLPNALPFTSILSLNVKEDAGCDPSRIMLLYGMSKDFGANGFRGGALVCQHNEKLMQAMSSNAMTVRIGSPTVSLPNAKYHRLATDVPRGMTPAC